METLYQFLQGVIISTKVNKLDTDNLVPTPKQNKHHGIYDEPCANTVFIRKKILKIHIIVSNINYFIVDILRKQTLERGKMFNYKKAEYRAYDLGHWYLQRHSKSTA